MEENNEVVGHHPHHHETGVNKNTAQIAGAIILAGIIIAGAILLKGTGTASVGGVANNNAPSTSFQGRPVSVNEHIIGNANAKIVIVEYSDLECPFCKSFHNTMHKVVEDSNGEVAWVFRHYPIPQLHPKATYEAEATECAFEQGGNDAFWKYTDRIFSITPSNNKLPDAELANTAAFIGLDVAAFNTCLESGKFKAKVQADVDDGVKAGVNGTPSSFILHKGKLVDRIPGAMPFESVMQKISAIK